MNKDEILNKLKPILAEKLNIDEKEITDDKTLKDLGADSLDAAEAIMAIESGFNFSIPDKDMEKFSNIKSIVDYIEKHQSAPATQA